MIWSVADDRHDVHAQPGLAVCRIDHDSRAVYALEGDDWADRQCKMLSPLPWECGLADDCFFHSPLVTDNETRRLARGALLACVARLRDGATSTKLHRLAQTLVLACDSASALEDWSVKARLLMATYNKQWSEVAVPQWQAFAQHLFDELVGPAPQG